MHLGATRDEVMTFVDSLYEDYLGRDPLDTGDAAGLNWWVDAALANNMTPEQLQQEFLKGAQPEVEWRKADLTNAIAPTDSRTEIWDRANDQLLEELQAAAAPTVQAPTQTQTRVVYMQAPAPVQSAQSPVDTRLQDFMDAQLGLDAQIMTMLQRPQPQPQYMTTTAAPMTGKSAADGWKKYLPFALLGLGAAVLLHGRRRG